VRSCSEECREADVKRRADEEVKRLCARVQRCRGRCEEKGVKSCRGACEEVKKYRVVQKRCRGVQM
jgi:hypothetical protein